MPVKIKSDWKSLSPNLAASRDLTRQQCLSLCKVWKYMFSFKTRILEGVANHVVVILGQRLVRIYRKITEVGTYESHISRVTLYTAGHLHTAVLHCSHSRAHIVHTAVPRVNNGHGCVYLRCRAVCKLPGCVEGHPCICSPTQYVIFQWRTPVGRFGTKITHWSRVTYICLIMACRPLSEPMLV